MSDDVLRDGGLLFLGSRLKRLGERLQADVLSVVEAAGLPVQPAHYPVLAALERDGPLTVGALVRLLGASQPGVTRLLARLGELGLIATQTASGDRRNRTMALTEAGRALLAESKAAVWPHIDAAVAELCGAAGPALLAELARVEAAQGAHPLAARALAGPMAGLRIRPFEDALAGAFHDINAEWISNMFVLEPTDREVLENPRARVIDPGGDILFVEAPGLGVVGAGALQRTGPGQFELTKMGVLDSARGRKAGEFLLRALIRRAGELGAERLYLLTSHKCAAAIHLYEKAGFDHDAAVMADFGARYVRCDVAMLYGKIENHSQ